MSDYVDLTRAYSNGRLLFLYHGHGTTGSSYAAGVECLTCVERNSGELTITAINISSVTPLPKAATDALSPYYGQDAGIPAAWEPDGADFFSPSLMEADLMRRVLPPTEFRGWLRRFLPDLPSGEPKSLLSPAKVTDRSDPQIVHLDGLNLSRAWCMRSITAALPKDDPARKVLVESAARHAEAGLRHVASGDYVGEHWLASFAVYLLSTPAPD